ncbi:single-stranded DNA-binding protein [Longivirga aurantiaca]|uniref:Single-stranded DNA-binding protein n=1 Tax=Longivirga aurantiaca TaxID=1837743 RepID=A0ABW1T4Z8_9ACTN
MRSTLTLAGNLTSNVTLRATAGGAVANFRMAVNDDWFDKKSGQWRSRTVYLQVSAWRRLAEHVADSLALGQPVLVVGRLRQREYEKDGQSHTVVEVEADAIGHDLSWGRARFERAPRGPQTADVAGTSGVAEPETVVVEHSGAAA